MPRNINEYVANAKGKLSSTVIAGHKLEKVNKVDPAKHNTKVTAIEFVIVTKSCSWSTVASPKCQPVCNVIFQVW